MSEPPMILALLKRWRCARCDTWNAPYDRRCHCCGSLPRPTTGVAL